MFHFPATSAFYRPAWIPTSNTCRRDSEHGGVATYAQQAGRGGATIPPSLPLERCVSLETCVSPQNGKETSGAGLMAQLSDVTFLKAKVQGPPLRTAGTQTLHGSMTVSCGLLVPPRRRAAPSSVLSSSSSSAASSRASNRQALIANSPVRRCGPSLQHPY